MLRCPSNSINQIDVFPIGAHDHMYGGDAAANEHSWYRPWFYASVVQLVFRIAAVCCADMDVWNSQCVLNAR
jgi:hypothetical protein